MSLADVRCVDIDPRFSSIGERVTDGLSGEMDRLTSWLCKSDVDLLWPMCSLSAIRLIMLRLLGGGTIKRSSGRSANVLLRTNFYIEHAPIGLVLMLTRFLGAEVHRSS